MSSLNRPVLVLNKLWIPIRIATVKRCIKLIFADKASVILSGDYSVYNWDKWFALEVEKGEKYIQSTRGEIKVPEVIVLLKYDKIRTRNLRLTKRNIYIRDKYACQYSGKRVNFKEADIDHIIPRSRGGKNSWENMVVCSKELNRKKGDRTPDEAGLKLIKKPSKPKTSELLIDLKLNIPKSWEKFIKIGEKR